MTSTRPIDQDAPSRLGSLVILVCLEGHQVLALGRRQLRAAGRAEDRVGAVHDMVYRQDHDLAVGKETDPSDGNRGQELQAPVERQYLEARMIGRVPWHFALR